MTSDGFPDYTVLFDTAKELGQQMVLDFPARVGRRPYVRYNNGEWEALSVGPVGQTDDGRAIIDAEEFDVTAADVRELLDEAKVVQLVYYNDTPFTGYEAWEYGDEQSIEESDVVVETESGERYEESEYNKSGE